MYLAKYLPGEATGDRITLSEFHVEMLGHAQTWVWPLRRLQQYRDIYVARRDSGKSLWLQFAPRLRGQCQAGDLRHPSGTWVARYWTIGAPTRHRGTASFRPE